MSSRQCEEFSTTQELCLHGYFPSFIPPGTCLSHPHHVLQLQYKMTYLERSTNLFNRVATSAADPLQAAPRWLRTEGECQNWAQYASQIQLSLSHPVLTNLCLFKGTTAGLLFQRHTLQCRTYGCTCGEIAVQWRADAVGLLSAIPSLSTFLGR